MVRFARADGSKGSNKRVLEESTPWSEFVSQRINKVEKVHKEGIPKKRKKYELLSDGESTFATEGKECKTDKKQQKIKENVTSENEIQEGEKCKVNPSITSKSEGEKKKKKNKGDKNTADLKQEFTVNSKGQRVKVFKDGTERTWFDLPYEENERMTLYDRMWVKREMVEKLDQLKESLQDLGEKEVMRKMMKAKRKAHRDLRIELIYEQKKLVSDETQGNTEGTGITETLLKKKISKKKKKKDIGNQIDYKVINTNENLRDEDLTEEGQKCIVHDYDKKDIGNQIDYKGINTNENLRDEDLTEEGQKCIVHEYDLHIGEDDGQNQEEHDQHNDQQKNVTDGRALKQRYISKRNERRRPVNFGTGANSIKIESGEVSEFNLGNKNQITTLDLEENDMMTKYEGFWVNREAVERLDSVKVEKLKSIYSARTDGNSTEELTPEEQITFQRAMKKEKRFENRKLMRKLTKTRGRGMIKGPNIFKTVSRGSNSYTHSVTESSNSKAADSEVVKFDGFWIKKESADRLNKLREHLTSEGVSGEELKIILQKERRKEERVLKNERKSLCLKCRKPGHMVSACPEVSEENTGGQIDICYTCGSTEHTSRDCSIKRKGSEYAHATCFICGDMGHICRECPDNPRGLYPNGGACRGCGSVEHLVKDCPDLQRENQKSNIKVNRIDGTALEALEFDEPDAAMNAEAAPVKINQVKVVKF